MSTMRQRFNTVLANELDANERVVAVLSDIGVAELRRAVPNHPRVVNVGIREQLQISVAAGFALEGFRPVAMSYTPFLVQRPFEQVKLDLGHQGVGAVIVTVAASYDAAHEGRTHQAPEDVALLSTLPGWTIHVPGHPDEVERQLRSALANDDGVYIRLTAEVNASPHAADGALVVRGGSTGAPLVVAVGPTLDPVLEATRDLDVTVAYLNTVRPFDTAGVRALADGRVVLVEPYLAGTSTPQLSEALSDRPHRLLALGVRREELRHYGTGADHRAAHGLDATGIRASIDAFLN
jgi:transketolase